MPPLLPPLSRALCARTAGVTQWAVRGVESVNDGLLLALQASSDHPLTVADSFFGNSLFVAKERLPVSGCSKHLGRQNHRHGGWRRGGVSGGEAEDSVLVGHAALQSFYEDREQTLRRGALHHTIEAWPLPHCCA